MCRQVPTFTACRGGVSKGAARQGDGNEDDRGGGLTRSPPLVYNQHRVPTTTAGALVAVVGWVAWSATPAMEHAVDAHPQTVCGRSVEHIRTNLHAIMT